MEEGRIVSKRRKEIAAWAVANFKRWPIPYETPDADPAEIGCELVIVPGRSSLPIMRCLLGGGYVDSVDWFYAKRNKKNADLEAERDFLLSALGRIQETTKDSHPVAYGIAEHAIECTHRDGDYKV